MELWSEKAVENGFKKLVLKHYPRAFHWKIWNGPMSKRGFPDVHLTLLGHTILLETKKYGAWLDGNQEEVLRRHARAGGLGGQLSIDQSHQSFVVVFIISDELGEYQMVSSAPVDATKEELLGMFNTHPKINMSVK